MGPQYYLPPNTSECTPPNPSHAAILSEASQSEAPYYDVSEYNRGPRGQRITGDAQWMDGINKDRQMMSLI